MQQKEGNPVPARKSIRERIMDCLSPQTDSSANQAILDGNEKDTKASEKNSVRNELSVVWNNYRYKKWGENTELPSLDELEEQLCAIVPRFSALFIL